MSAPTFFVTAATGTADLLAAELAALGIADAREVLGGVTCASPLAGAYRACLWSRVGLRVLWRIAEFPVADADEMYRRLREIDWSTHMDVGDTLAVDFSGSVAGISHTQFGAQRVKDAIVDQFRDATGQRPSVDRAAPTLRINVHAARGAVVVAIDLSGDSLHRRGYRGGQGAAPLKENLAAAVLLRAGWPAIAATGGAFVDPMCGSGTLAIEAALIAADIAPGLSRKGFGFERWKQHDAGSWQAIRAEAQSQSKPELLTRGRIRGFDRDPVVLRDAALNAERAGLADRILFQRSELANLPAAPAPTGLIAVNPPYGERIGETEELRVAVRVARRAAAGGLSRLGGGGVHGQPAARPRTRDQCAAHAPDDERSDRMPAVAAFNRAVGIHRGARAGHGRRSSTRPAPARDPARRCSRTACART